MSAHRPRVFVGHWYENNACPGIRYYTSSGSSGFVVFVTMRLRLADAGSCRTGYRASVVHETEGTVSSIHNNTYHALNSNHNKNLAPNWPVHASPLGRILPKLPIFIFSATDLIAETVPGDAHHDVPLSIYRRQRLLRALGHLHQGHILPPARSIPASPTDRTDKNRHGQYKGDVSVVTWNAGAFFTTDPARFDAKVAYTRKLLDRADVLLITEGHGTDGGNKVWPPPFGCTTWWTAGPTAAHAGVGIIAKNSFLQNFESSPSWTVIWPGRAARLSLRGPSGSLDLLVVYFHTGAEVTELDLYGAYPSHRPHCTSFPKLREHMRCRVGQAIAPQTSVLTIMAGDFNWVTADADRRALTTMDTSGSRDAGEERHFNSVVSRTNGLHEMHQPDMTRMSARSRARLDRVYSNQHAIEQLDRQINVWRWSGAQIFRTTVQFSFPVRHLRNYRPAKGVSHELFIRIVIFRGESLWSMVQDLRRSLRPRA